MKTRIRAFAVIVVSTLFLTSCSGGNTSDNSLVQEMQKKPQIGITFDNFVVERWLRDRDVFVAEAENQGAEVIVQNANGSADEQISQIEYFIQKKVDVIVIVAVDGDKLVDVVKSAKKAGIKVIAYDRLIRNANVDLYISFDNEKVGRLMAESLVASIPGGGKIFVIRGPKTDYNVDMVEKGFMEVIMGSNLKIAYDTYCQNWLSEQAYAAVIEGLKTTPDVAGIMCGNDDLASRAFLALAENRLAGKVILVGQDADLSACQRIVEGTQKMTVYKSVDVLAKSAAAYAIQFADGDSLMNTTDPINDGTYNVPYKKIEPVAVTIDNIDEKIIESGFHLREDVYLNVKQAG